MGVNTPSLSPAKNGARASRIRSSSEALESRRGDLRVAFQRQGIPTSAQGTTTAI